MIAKGTFEVNMAPQQDDVPVGRFTLDKTFSGDVIGKGAGQMISKRLENGTAVYFAIEEFEGSINGKEGSFTFLHRGRMTSASQSLDISILEGSGSGELASISGSLSIHQEGGHHSYELQYKL